MVKCDACDSDITSYYEVKGKKLCLSCYTDIYKDVSQSKKEKVLKSISNEYSNTKIKDEIERKIEINKKPSFRITHAEILGAICGFICFISAFLPWASVRSGFGEVSVNGIERDGIITLIFSLITIGLLYLGTRRTKKNVTNAGMVVMGFLITIIGVVDGANVSGIDSSSYVNIGVGIGLYLTLLGGIGIVVSGIWNQKLSMKKQNQIPDELQNQIQDDDVIKMVKIRYAKGEITKEQYEQMKKDLEK